ncbi:MAG: AAA family ATPase [Clostridia bacterium]|nr:AAA family ATPase [Clostridia bacterium]
MKISKIEIASFGGLKNTTIDFSDNFNLVFGENENGKTTLMTFIKCMFYGTGKRKNSLKESAREKYTPWDGSKMGGRIYFSHNDTNYCLEREFRTSDSTDRVTLTNKDTGFTVSEDKKPGEKLFMMSEGAFIRSVFIDNNVSFESDSAAEADFNSRLSNIDLADTSDVSQKTVEKRIGDARNAVLSKSGRAGTLVKDRENLQVVKDHLSKAFEQEKQMSEISASLDEINKNISDIEKEIEKEKQIVKNENAVKSAKQVAEYLELKAKMAELEKELKTEDGKALPVTFSKIVSSGLANYKQLKAKEDDLEKEVLSLDTEIKDLSSYSPLTAKEGLSALENEEKALSEKIASLSASVSDKEAELALKKETLEKKGKGGGKIAMFISGGCLIALFLLLTFVFSVSYAISLPSAAFGVILVILGFSFGRKDNLSDEINRLQGEINTLSSEIANLNTKIVTIDLKKTKYLSADEARTAVIDAKKKDLEKKEEKLNEIKQKCQLAKTEVITYFSKWKTVESVADIERENAGLSAIYEKRNEISALLTHYTKELGNLTEQEATEILKKAETNGEDDTDFEAHKERLESLTERLSSLNSDKARYETMLDSSFTDYISSESIIRIIGQVEEIIKSKEEYVAALDIASEVLNESAIGIRKSYGSKLQENAKDIFTKLTGGKYKTLNVDSSMHLDTEETDNFGTRTVDYLSRGASDQAYLSLRLAISKLLSNDEPLPVMLDDALSQFDDRRSKLAVDFLSDYSKDNQIILFTCHGSVLKDSKNAGANIIEIK